MADTARSPLYHNMPAASASSSGVQPAMAPPPMLSPPIVATPMNQHAPSNNREASPNYFGYQSDGNSFLSDSPRHVKNNWSPPSSAIRSAVQVSPSFVPVDQNPDYDAFRRQSDSNKAFSMASLNGFKLAIPGAQRPTAGRTPSSHTPSLQIANGVPRPRPQSKDGPVPAHRAQLDPNPSELSRSPKRMLSNSALGDQCRGRGSPGDNPDSDSCKSPKECSNSFPRFQLPLDGPSGPSGALQPRAKAIPSTGDDSSQDFIMPERLVSLLTSRQEDVLLLDLRVATQYGTAHIAGALSLCIPTTLLKRPSFDVRKLADTFRDEKQRHQFENWRNSSFIIVYDASSTQLKDASTCSNTIQKFRSEGYQGTLHIVYGGFNGFAKRCPSYVESAADVQSSVEGDGPSVAPAVGGCPMPSTDAPANPFFGNIRQNMDLIGGVGQIELKHPSAATTDVEEEFPQWLKQAADEGDKGHKVSQLFEQIERREQKRMENALSGQVSYGTPRPDSNGSVQIAGLEKGSKNRYNNIWPFEHSRVKLQGVSSHGCDYFNASYIKSSRSHKSYISTQAPIPATFNDFWNVVWQQDVRVIVMLTAEKEGAQIKAHNYWDQNQYGALHLDFLSEKKASLELSRIHKHQRRPANLQRHSTASANPTIPVAPLDTTEDKQGGEQPFVTVRKFTLKHEKHPFEPMREITQLQYSGWPDFGAPAHPAHLLGLVEQCDAVVRATNKTHSTEPEPPHKRPILVHCSAGCGRTGTFCTVDSVIDMLKRQRLSSHNTSPKQDMDVDRSPAAAAGFFSPAAKSAETSPDSVDGSWVGRDDQDLVARTVEDFRGQRISMVQSLRQFVLCYESVMEWLVEQEMSPPPAT